MSAFASHNRRCQQCVEAACSWQLLALPRYDLSDKLTDNVPDHPLSKAVGLKRSKKYGLEGLGATEMSRKGLGLVNDINFFHSIGRQDISHQLAS